MRLSLQTGSLCHFPCHLPPMAINMYHGKHPGVLSVCTSCLVIRVKSSPFSHEQCMLSCRHSCSSHILSLYSLNTHTEECRVKSRICFKFCNLCFSHEEEGADDRARPSDSWMVHRLVILVDFFNMVVSTLFDDNHFSEFVS